jgi:hypothetical protein
VKSSIMMNTRRTENACQSNTASSVQSNSCILSIVDITCASNLGHVDNIVNREDASHHYFMYLYFVLLFFIAYLIFLLHQYPNYRVE